MRSRRSICSALLVVGLWACDDGGGDAAPTADATPIDAAAPDAAAPTVDLAQIPYDRLSQYGFFAGDDLTTLQPAAGVHPYLVTAVLWSDDAGKERFVYLPPGGAIVVGGDEDWRLPVGSVVIKNFWFADDQRDREGTARLLETRLLIHEAEGWTGHVYVWNAAQTDAERVVAGRRLTLDYLDRAGAAQRQTYLVPNTNQCDQCHANDDVTGLLGLVTRQVDRMVEVDGVQRPQLEVLAERGVFAAGADFGDTPRLVDPFGDAPVADRARSYLDANCAHCHRPGGGGGPSGLVLLHTEQRPVDFGVCRAPVAAGPGAGGRTADIVPGRPDESILVYRMSSTDPEIKMPELPNLTVDAQAIEVVRAWIAEMEPAGCP